MDFYDKIISLLQGIDVFLRTTATLTKAGFKVFAPLAIFSVIYVNIPPLLAALSTHLQTFLSSGSIQGIASISGKVNVIFPLTEYLAILSVMLLLQATAAAIRIIKSVIPGLT